MLESRHLMCPLQYSTSTVLVLHVVTQAPHSRRLRVQHTIHDPFMLLPLHASRMASHALSVGYRVAHMLLHICHQTPRLVSGFLTVVQHTPIARAENELLPRGPVTQPAIYCSWR